MKNRRSVLFLGLAAVCGMATASVGWKADDGGPRGVPVVVASEAALPGRSVDQSKLQVMSWPAKTVPQGAFNHPSALTNRVLARSLVPGEPILESALLPVGTAAGLGALIEENSLAVSIQVDQFVGVGGFVQPGSRVDVVATLDGRTNVVLQNLKVLAVDVRVDRSEGSSEPAQVVTLEVSPKQASTLTHAENSGSLKLALRNPNNDEESSTVQVVLGTDVYGTRF